MIKKVSAIILVLCAVTIVYLFIKEQFKGVVLSDNENLLLSITYLLVGISLLVLYIIQRNERRNQQNSNK